MAPALMFFCGFGLALCLVVAGMAAEAMAQRGQRIYRARRRDHSAVPSIK
ncbi:hypothetical protein [Variovorax sp. V118]